MEKQETIYINIDKAVDLFNEGKELEEKVDRTKLCEELGISYQTMVNYSNGRVPVIVGHLKKIIEKTGIDFKDLVTINK